VATIKHIIKKILPPPIVERIRNYRSRKALEAYKRFLPSYKNLPTQELFTKVYEDGAWGKSDDPSQKYFSGSGSHDNIIVETYIQAIHKFLRSFDKKPNVVDVGCGDFFIGSRIRSACGTYTACDVVLPLIDFNKNKYKSLNVDFKVLDLTKDELPSADICFVRQVLQHLTNAQIKSAIPQISSKFRYLVVTEHLPNFESFTPNLDQPAGPDNRLAINSGIVLTSAPFNLKVIEESQLCRVSEMDGTIKTTLYKVF
jgi:Methyltransferase domain